MLQGIRQGLADVHAGAGGPPRRSSLTSGVSLISQRMYDPPNAPGILPGELMSCAGILPGALNRVSSF